MILIRVSDTIFFNCRMKKKRETNNLLLPAKLVKLHLYIYLLCKTLTVFLIYV